MKRPLSVLCFAAVGILFLYIHIFPPQPSQGEGLPDGEYTISGRVYQKEYRPGDGKTNLILYLSELSVQSFPYPNQGEFNSNKLICYMEETKAPSLGSAVVIKGYVEVFPAPTNPGEFDAPSYYAVLGIDRRLTKGILLSVTDRGNTAAEVIWQLKTRLSQNLDRNLSPEAASVMKTMLLGERGAVQPQLKEMYRSNGIIHILAISGLHISLIGIGIYRLLRKLGLPILAAAPSGVLLMLLYGFMTGMGISTMRAIGMFLLHMLAVCIGRSYDMLTAAGVMALLLACMQPLYLTHSGFLLSFGSLLGIGCLCPALTEGMEEKKKYREGITDILYRILSKSGKAFAAGASITLMTFPVLLWYYYEFPLYGTLLNLIVIPLMPLLMSAGLYAMLAPAAAAWPAGCIIEGVLLLYDKLCGMAQNLPFHTILTGRPSVWRILCYLCILCLIIWGRERLSRRIRWSLLPAALLIITVPAHSGLQVTFLDVGQGDSICIQAKAGEAWLVDGGSSSKKEVGEYRILPFLRNEGIHTLRTIFITHPDSDHINGISQLLEQDTVRIQQIAIPGMAKESQSTEFAQLLKLAEGKNIPVISVQKGTTFSEGRFNATCLHPPGDFPGVESNAYSQVWYMEYDGFSMLLTGDVEGEGETLVLDELSRRGIRNISVLKVSHHGSAYSTPQALLDQLNPVISVISCARKNSYGHPHSKLLHRLSQTSTTLYVTAHSGAVTVKTDGGMIRVAEFLKR